MKQSRKTALIAGVALGAITSIAAADIQFFGRENFRGPEFTAQGSIDNLDSTRFNDRASSAIVRGGPWLVCSDAYFRGHCVTLRPGEYPSLNSMGIGDSISSARELRGQRYGAIDRDDRYRGPARVTLYEGPNFSGRSLVVDRDAVRDLDPTGLNDRVSSLRVEGAPWTFCTDSYFRGDCRTFNPGEYPYLPGEMQDRISSGHQSAPEPYAEGNRY